MSGSRIVLGMVSWLLVCTLAMLGLSACDVPSEVNPDKPIPAQQPQHQADESDSAKLPSAEYSPSAPESAPSADQPPRPRLNLQLPEQADAMPGEPLAQPPLLPDLFQSQPQEQQPSGKLNLSAKPLLREEEGRALPALEGGELRIEINTD